MFIGTMGEKKACTYTVICVLFVSATKGNSLKEEWIAYIAREILRVRLYKTLVVLLFRIGLRKWLSHRLDRAPALQGLEKLMGYAVVPRIAVH